MLSAVLFFALGIVLLVAGGDLFVRGLSTLALASGAGRATVGASIVTCGIALPELAVSLVAARRASHDTVLGTILGTGILNIGFVLGLSALLVPLHADRGLTRADAPILLATTVLMLVFVRIGQIDRLMGFALVLMFLVFLVLNLHRARSAIPDERVVQPWRTRLRAMGGAIAFCVLGIAALAGGSESVVRGSEALVESLGKSPKVVALTIIAAGTTLPEFAAVLTALSRRMESLAIGAVLDATMFTLLGALGITALVTPLEPNPAFARDAGVLVGFALALTLILLSSSRIGRVNGAILSMASLAYLVRLYLE